MNVNVVPCPPSGDLCKLNQHGVDENNSTKENINAKLFQETQSSN